MKKILALVMAMAIIVSLAPAYTVKAAAVDGDPVTIKFSLSHAATEPACVAAYEFADAVAEKSGGNMTVEVYPDNQLGSERDVVEGLQLHTVQMVDPANAVLSNFVPEVGIFSLPMLFESKEQLYEALDTVGMTFVDKCAEQGLQLLGWFDMGTRHIMTVNKPIESMDDMKGLKIRTQESTVELAGMASFGAASMPMAYNELYTALESGVLDGAEAANTNYLAKAFYEVAPNWAIVAWLEVVCPVLMDKQFYDNLTDSQKAVLEECVADMLVSEREKYAQSEEDALAELEANGVNITHPDRAPFQEKAIEIYKQFEGDFGKENIEGLLGHSYE